MASWMIHFRVAEALMDELFPPERLDAPDASATAFVLGNIAPDSGSPAPDGSGYIPDKDTSHFMRRFDDVPPGENPERCDPHGFAETWLEPALDQDDLIGAAFYLGYLCHLVTDNAWVRDFIYPAKLRFAHLRRENGVETPEGIARFYAFLKRDWYDLDFLYLLRRPDMPVYRLYREAPRLDNEFLPFFTADAFERKRGEIEEFYRKGVVEVENREVYITDVEIEAFIQSVVTELLGYFGDLCEVFCSKLTSYSQI